MHAENQIYCFKPETFFKKGEPFFIHLSTEFPDFVGVIHRHEFIEIVYVLSGNAVHTVGERAYTVKRGDVVLINYGVPHKFTATEDTKEPFVAYDLMFTPDFLDASMLNLHDFSALQTSFLFLSLFPDETAQSPDMHIQSSFTDFGKMFAGIYHEYTCHGKGYAELIRAYVIELIIKLFRELEQSGRRFLSASNAETVATAVAYMTTHYDARMRVEDIAAKVFLHPDYFRKLFKSVTGLSVSAFLQKTRVDEACRLLTTTALPIQEIATSCGYGDMKSFYQSFKKLTGKTPNEYRISQ